MAREWSERSEVHRALKAVADPQRGEDVKALQAALNQRGRARGLPTVKVDGTYGADTARSVRQVGYALGAADTTLATGGTIGLQRIIRSPATRTPAQLARAARRRVPLRERALAQAVADLGVREQGGNNRGPDVERIIREAGGTPGEAWCGDGVLVWYKRAGSKMTSRAWAYVPTLEKLLTRVTSPQPGHVVIYNWNGGEPDHTGLFKRWIVKGVTFEAVEGNTGPDGNTSDGNGNDGVRVRTRHVDEVDSFRRVIR